MPRGTTLYDEALLQGRLWTPELIRSSLAAWWDADDLSTITVGTGVSAWRDKSGRDNNATAASAQPVYSINGFNGRNCLTFSGSQRLTVPHSASLALNDYTIIGVVDDDSGANSFRAWIEKAPDNQATNRKWWVGTSGSFYVLNATLIADTEGNNVRNVGSVSLEPQIVVHTKPSSGTAFLFQGGVQTASDSTIGNLTNTSSVSIGSQFYPWIGKVGEILIYSRVLSDAERLVIEGYLAYKWRLQSSLFASHPFRNRPPLIGD